MKVSLALHLIGIVFWLGSLIVLTRLLSLGSDVVPKINDDLKRLSGKVFWGFSVGGLVLSTITGLYQITSSGVGYYMKQGWFHGKLTLVILLYGVTVVTAVQVKKFQFGAALSRKTVGILHGSSSLILVIAVFLTILGR